MSTPFDAESWPAGYGPRDLDAPDADDAPPPPADPQTGEVAPSPADLNIDEFLGWVKLQLGRVEAYGGAGAKDKPAWCPEWWKHPEVVERLIVAYQVFSLPFAIWLLRGFFAEIPRDIGEAAQLDGCSNLGVLWRMYVPLSVPGIAAVVILNSIRIWNELTYALALTFSNAQTVPLSVASFRGYGQMDWGAMSAGAVISAAPMVVMALFAQRYIVRGLTLGSLKD